MEGAGFILMLVMLAGPVAAEQNSAARGQAQLVRDMMVEPGEPQTPAKAAAVVEVEQLEVQHLDIMEGPEEQVIYQVSREVPFNILGVEAVEQTGRAEREERQRVAAVPVVTHEEMVHPEQPILAAAVVGQAVTRMRAMQRVKVAPA